MTATIHSTKSREMVEVKRRELRSFRKASGATVVRVTTEIQK
jgi:hypothetical protein